MTVTESIILAAGCFWCIQQKFDETVGILKTTVGYIGGKSKNPNYEEVCEGDTGHFEAIMIEYDPNKISLNSIIEIYLQQVDPENPYGQFCDIGTQYLLAIFYQNDKEKQIAKMEIEKFFKAHQLKANHIRLLPKTKFYPAEEYHQKFYEKNPIRYQQYKSFSGRKERLNEIQMKKT